MIDLKSLNEEDLSSVIGLLGLPLYREKQLIHWIYERGVTDVRDITELPVPLRERLSRIAYISSLKLIERQVSGDGTEKFLFGLEDGETIETVLIPDGGRRTLCISSQVGCAMGCRFCLTARIGFVRNLTAHEIADQVITVRRLIKPEELTGIVLMGMGEPLNNLDGVADALWRITGHLRISKRRITISTAGVVPVINRLPGVIPSVNLAVSLNATTNAVRDMLMPVNRRYQIEELLSACRNYPLDRRRRITFEYILIEGLNDNPEDAERLVIMLRGIPSKINLIPLNPFEGAEFRPSSDEKILAFQQILIRRGMTALIRKSKGRDILAACGQLKGHR